VPVLGPVAIDEAGGGLRFSFSMAGDAVVLTGVWRGGADGGAALTGAGSGTAATLLLGFFEEVRRVAPAAR
jgi:membrane carboxypeptidase/penicillin-binding protein PbpC